VQGVVTTARSEMGLPSAILPHWIDQPNREGVPTYIVRVSEPTASQHVRISERDEPYRQAVEAFFPDCVRFFRLAHLLQLSRRQKLETPGAK
jgi:hypothetical protein